MDAKTIARHRRSMLRDMGYRDQTALESMMERFLPGIERKLELCEYLGWLALIEGEFVIAGAGLWLMDWPANMIGSSAKRGNILNVYTEPAFRRRGLARWLIEAALHWWCKANDIDFAIVHASQEGRRLYESLAFRPGNEMRIKF